MTNAFPAHSEADWRAAAEAGLKGGAFDKLVSTTADGLRLGPLYAGREGPRALRGQGGAWKAICRVDQPSPDDFAAAALEDLENGANGLDVVFAGSGGAYGFGLARTDSAALHRAFEGVRFDAGARFNLDIADFRQSMAIAAHIERVGTDAADVDVAFGLDPLGAHARTGAPGAEMAALAPTVAELRGRGFRGPFVAADARAVHDAGGTPGQELAFALSAGLAYLRALEMPEAIEFRLAADADQFATLAKFRAMRLLWARALSACGVEAAPARLNAVSAWRMMTVAEPFVNVMRTALAAFAAGLGGADSVTLLPFSQAIGLPDAFARRLARNTQLIELREARLDFVADPAAGAGVFEALTEGLCEKAWALFQSFEAAGGLAAALERGLVQEGVKTAAEALKRDVARGKTLLTGVSAHPHLAAERVTVLPDAANYAAPAEGALAPLRLSEPFERLREKAKSAPKMFLAAMGPLAAHTQRLRFASEFFEAGGIATIPGAGATSAVALATEFAASGARAACLCGTDDAYAADAEAFTGALKTAGARVCMLAGRPGEREAAWRAAGVDGFIYTGADRIATLDELLARLTARRD
jgi:methylmalonyl-CoA mutase